MPKENDEYGMRNDEYRRRFEYSITSRECCIMFIIAHSVFIIWL